MLDNYSNKLSLNKPKNNQSQEELPLIKPALRSGSNEPSMLIQQNYYGFEKRSKADMINRATALI